MKVYPGESYVVAGVPATVLAQHVDGDILFMSEVVFTMSEFDFGLYRDDE